MRHPDVEDVCTFYAYIEPDSDFTMKLAYERVCDALPKLLAKCGDDYGPLSTNGHRIRIDTGGVYIFLTREAGRGIGRQARELAKQLGDRPEGAALALCGRRLEMEVDYSRSKSGFQANFPRIIEALRSFRGMHILDPDDPVGTYGGPFVLPK